MTGDIGADDLAYGDDALIGDDGYELDIPAPIGLGRSVQRGAPLTRIRAGWEAFVSHHGAFPRTTTVKDPQ